jgi:hypothetical protein
MEKRVEEFEATPFGAAALETAAPQVHPESSQANPTHEAQAASAAQWAAIGANIARSANWFYWIAGLSLVNLLVGVSGGQWKFAIGLGISELLSGIADEVKTGGGSTAVIVVLYAASLCVTAFFATCGWFARRPSAVAFIVGMVAFGLDTIVFVMFSDWMGVAFHGLALYYLWRGLSITLQVKKLQK